MKKSSLPAAETRRKNYARHTVRTGFGVVALSTGAIALLSAPVQADLQITSEVRITRGATATTTTTSAPTPPPTQTYTTYYKGRKARLTDSTGNLVILYDRDADRVYTVDMAQKTFYSHSFKDTFHAVTTLPESLKSRFSLDTSAKLNALQVSTGDNKMVEKTETVLGTSATDYTLTGYTSLDPQESGGNRGSGAGTGLPGGGGRRGGRGGRGGGGGFPGGSGGGFPGGSGGGFPGGGGGTGGGRRAPGGTPSGVRREPSTRVNLEGAVWGTDSVSLLPTGKKDQKEMLLPLAQQLLPVGSPLLEEVAKQLADKKILPLRGDLTLATTRAAHGGFPTPPGTSTATPPAPASLMVHLEVKSVQQNVTLEDSLFTLPAGFKQVDPPAPSETPLSLTSGS